MVITITQTAGQAPETTLLLQPSPEDRTKIVNKKVPGLVYEVTRTPNDIYRYKIKTAIWKSLTQDEIENFFEEDHIARIVAKAADNDEIFFFDEDEMDEEIACQRHTTIPKPIIFAVLQGLYNGQPMKFVLTNKRWTPEYIRKAVQVVLSELNKETITGKSVTFTYNF